MPYHSQQPVQSDIAEQEDEWCSDAAIPEWWTRGSRRCTRSIVVRSSTVRLGSIGRGSVSRYDET